MEALLWDLRNRAGESLAEVTLALLVASLVLFWDYPVMLVRSLMGRALFDLLPEPLERSRLPAVLVVIPTLLRRKDELTSLLSTVRSICENGYPGPVTVVVSIDGAADSPPLYAQLRRWAEQATWPERTAVFVTGTPGRHGKPMAIERGVRFVEDAVEAGDLAEFPPVYVSTDADADLGPRALEMIVRRLHRPNRFTGNRPHVVAGALHVRGDGFWKGWKHALSATGQLNLQVAREYYVSNVGRHNLRLLPVTGVPGAFYCTWSELFRTIPRYLAFLRTLRARHWLAWWVGVAPPRFADCTAAPIPELMAGDTDDTVTAYVATMARFEDDRLSLELPRTPLHALGRMLRTLFLERPLQYEPAARVYTSSPDTVKALFKQRRRWNSSRIELTLRLWPGLTYHWGIGLPALVVLGFMLRGFVAGALGYVLVPLVFFRAQVVTGLLAVYAAQLLVAALLTLLALLINDELRSWRLALALPLTPAYNITFNWAPAALGMVHDVLLFGNVTGFAPEWTLKAGRSVRIALLFRLRRGWHLLLRAARHGDVPLGAFWLGWQETPWTPSGFEGWTTGKRPRPVRPRERPP